MLPLAFTENKKAIRCLWDKSIIAAFSENWQRQLDYFGLPGPDVQDFVSWHDHLGWKTAIEYVPPANSRNSRARDDSLRNVQRLQRNMMLRGYLSEWELRKGRLEDIILDGADIDGNQPELLSIVRNRRPRMHYDLHNWDFQGGLGYVNSNREARRVEAIKKCIELQMGHPFLFLLTLNVRHKLDDQPSKYLNGMSDEYGLPQSGETLKWYSDQGNQRGGDHYRTTMTTIMLVRQTAHLNSFDCICYPPIYYEGAGSEHFLHFVFTLIPEDSVLPVFSRQLFSEVVTLPLIEVR